MSVISKDILPAALLAVVFLLLPYAQLNGLGLIKCVVPVGFTGCNESWFKTPPTISTVDSVYTADEIRKLAYQYEGKGYNAGQYVVNIKVLNAGDKPIAARYSTGKPMRFSWRFLDFNGAPEAIGKRGRICHSISRPMEA